jgi:hypothetical protein
MQAIATKLFSIAILTTSSSIAKIISIDSPSTKKIGTRKTPPTVLDALSVALVLKANALVLMVFVDRAGEKNCRKYRSSFSFFAFFRIFPP